MIQFYGQMEEGKKLKILQESEQSGAIISSNLDFAIYSWVKMETWLQG